MFPTDSYISTGGKVENDRWVWKPANLPISYEISWDEIDSGPNDDHIAGRYLCLGVLRNDDKEAAMEPISCDVGLRPFFCQKNETKSG